jgi:hypothetical protein
MRIESGWRSGVHSEKKIKNLRNGVEEGTLLIECGVHAE